MKSVVAALAAALVLVIATRAAHAGGALKGLGGTGGGGHLTNPYGNGWWLSLGAVAVAGEPLHADADGTFSNLGWVGGAIAMDRVDNRHHALWYGAHVTVLTCLPESGTIVEASPEVGFAVVGVGAVVRDTVVDGEHTAGVGGRFKLTSGILSGYLQVMKDGARDPFPEAGVELALPLHVSNWW